MNILIIFLISLCYGSFLNVLAHRLVSDKSLFIKRSKCPYCDSIISWFDNIPLISWLFLKTRCRKCKNKISVLYPLTELITAILLTLLFVNLGYGFPIGVYVANIVFITALICAARTDLEAMVIPQIFTLWLVPLGIVFSYLNFLTINVYESIIAAVVGYGILWVIAWGFKKVTNKEGLGEGDIELLAMIGSFIGLEGMYFALMIGSLVGLGIGIIYLFITKQGKNTPIPYGPFLVFGALVYFYTNYLIQII